MCVPGPAQSSGSSVFLFAPKEGFPRGKGGKGGGKGEERDMAKWLAEKGGGGKVVLSEAYLGTFTPFLHTHTPWARSASRYGLHGEVLWRMLWVCHFEQGWRSMTVSSKVTFSTSQSGLTGISPGVGRGVCVWGGGRPSRGSQHRD